MKTICLFIALILSASADDSSSSIPLKIFSITYESLKDVGISADLIIKKSTTNTSSGKLKIWLHTNNKVEEFISKNGTIRLPLKRCISSEGYIRSNQAKGQTTISLFAYPLKHNLIQGVKFLTYKELYKKSLEKLNKKLKEIGLPLPTNTLKHMIVALSEGQKLVLIYKDSTKEIKPTTNNHAIIDADKILGNPVIKIIESK